MDTRATVVAVLIFTQPYAIKCVNVSFLSHKILCLSCINGNRPIEQI